IEPGRQAQRSQQGIYTSTCGSGLSLENFAAACRNANTTGCGFCAVEDSCGWNNVARKKRCEADSMARISPAGPRATVGSPASIVQYSYSGLISKLQKNSSSTRSC